MADVNMTKLRQLDLTLLTVFAEAMRHRKLTVVASRLGLTPSAISHSLRRLRQAFGDELFLRRPFGVEPTRRAIDIAPQIDKIIELSGTVLGGFEAFEPQTSHRLFHIAGSDHEMSLVAPALIACVRKIAPSVRLSFRPQMRLAAIKALQDGQADVALGLFRSCTKDFERLDLFEENYRVLVRKNHPTISKRLDLKTYLAADHVLASIGGDLKGIVDLTLAKKGVSRKVVAAVPSFFAALSVVAGSDVITTLPARMAERYRKRFELDSYAPPVPIRSFSVAAIWHRRNSADPGLRWLIGQLRRACEARSSTIAR